jgi:uncharacterized protein YggT (Ycf19 family)
MTGCAKAMAAGAKVFKQLFTIGVTFFRALQKCTPYLGNLDISMFISLFLIESI